MVFFHRVDETMFHCQKLSVVNGAGPVALVVSNPKAVRALVDIEDGSKRRDPCTVRHVGFEVSADLNLAVENLVRDFFDIGFVD